jgi:hypothetical protein
LEVAFLSALFQESPNASPRHPQHSSCEPPE